MRALSDMTSILKIFLLILLTIIAAISSSYGMGFPVDCELGKNCWIVNLPRHFVEDNRRGNEVDFSCGSKTYPGHKGTDIAIRNLAKMEQGVDVLATVDSVVRGMRDGMDDVNIREAGQDSIKGRECGNGVVLRADGFEYQYCHLKKGSINVRAGDKIEKGEVIGQIGLSGNTEYPHLHLSVRKKYGDTWIDFDPFYGKGIECGLEPSPIWENSNVLTQSMQTGIVYHYGFSFEVPKVTKVRQGIYDDIEYNSRPEMIIGWVEVFSANQGDKVIIKLYSDKAEEPIIKEHIFNKYKARYFLYAGKKLQGKEISPRAKIEIDYYHSNGEVDHFEKYLK